MSPASSSTFRCWEIAGCVISNGSANSLTVASPLARRARSARRVGSAKAEKAASKDDISDTLYKWYIIVKWYTREGERSSTKIEDGVWRIAHVHYSGIARKARSEELLANWRNIATTLIDSKLTVWERP